jgi:hypothetical protein
MMNVEGVPLPGLFRPAFVIQDSVFDIRQFVMKMQ